MFKIQKSLDLTVVDLIIDNLLTLAPSLLSVVNLLCFASANTIKFYMNQNNSKFKKSIGPCPSREQLINFVESNLPLFSKIFSEEVNGVKRIELEFESFCDSIEAVDVDRILYNHFNFVNTEDIQFALNSYHQEMMDLADKLNLFIESKDMIYYRTEIESLKSIITTFTSRVTPIQALKHQRAKVLYLRALWSACMDSSVLPKILENLT